MPTYAVPLNRTDPVHVGYPVTGCHRLLTGPHDLTAHYPHGRTVCDTCVDVAVARTPLDTDRLTVHLPELPDELPDIVAMLADGHPDELIAAHLGLPLHVLRQRIRRAMDIELVRNRFQWGWNMALWNLNRFQPHPPPRRRPKTGRG